MNVMKMTYVLPLVFSLGFLAVGTGLLLKAYNSQDGITDPDDITMMLLKGAGLAIVGLAMLGIIVWKSGWLRKRK